MSLLHAAIITPFALALLAPLLYRRMRRIHAGWFVLPGPIVLFAFFLSRIPAVAAGGNRAATVPWIPSLGIDLTVYLDGLGLLFALLITGIGSLVVLYSIYYLDQTKEALAPFYVYLLLFMGAMLGVVLSDNLMVLYGFWELTSIASFLLIAFWHQRAKSKYGAQKSMLITVFGGFAMFAGFLLLYMMTGTFSLREIAGQLEGIASHKLFLPAMLLMLLGAFTKSAQFPFHIWLPDAMEAPTPVSAYLHSATMVKAGLYLVARFSPIFAGRAEWFWIVSGLGLVTLLYGSYRAFQQKDLKAMLAFSTISQLGLIMCLLGLGSASAYHLQAGTNPLIYAKATMAAVFHLINHAVFKGTLFMVAGIVDHETGTRDIRKLGGLMAVMPVTFSAALAGTFAMAGLNGFLSKEMFFTAALNALRMDFWNMRTWSLAFPAIAWIASVFTFLYSMILLFRTFTGRLQAAKLKREPHEAPLGMLIPPVVLASLAVTFGLFPNLLSYSLIEPAMSSILPGLPGQGERYLVSIDLWHGFTPELWMTIGVVAVGTVLYRLYGRLDAIHRLQASPGALNRMYDRGLRALESAAHRLTGAYMTGSVRRYLLYIFTFMIAALALAMLGSGRMIRYAMSELAPVSLYETVIVAVMIVAAMAVPLARTRLAAIIFTGAIGYMVTLLFVLFRAPDLALTQMIVETVSVTLFLLCFFHLPKLSKEMTALRFKLANAVIAVGVGAVVTFLALGAAGERKFPSISDFFLAESYRSAGGKNVVNVILVDFRGFDTMLEIVVLGIASLGIYAMIKLQMDSHAMGLRAPARNFRYPRSNDVILRTISKVAIFIILTFSFYLFFAGHNEPGGGFIGALMTAAAFVLLSIAFGMNMFHLVVPVDFRKAMAFGLLTAFLTGIGSFVFGAPFLSHTFGHFHLPLLGETELATATLFDFGVYLAVVGVAMSIIFTIGRDI
ncbi:Na+/H+ antiporter subunit A [Paenibacillus sp. MSJ-34]|uniref:Na+/H+ antiporter subunit A n=1 Tax=Paenibacillus sp. MSJ-34 TaxID=2841529 RepID=UPI001C1058D5|nr:Na+/H+ antiporter subunit A [Paenibacillus sp. MSJ-34]MBU5442732.1 Na+/H+ antiporter subunit A [Paenibacillus sp. MSJ-34]